VLPIQNLTASAADRGLADGLTEEITQALAQNGYPVVARTTASLWRERAADVRELGATLGVSHVLEGSVRRQGERVRVSMQLIATDTGKHVWAESFEQAGEDSFALQDRVTSLVAAKISRTVWADEGALKRSPEFARVAQLVIDGRRLFFESRFDEALAANARVLEATPEHEPYLRLRSDVHALLELAWESLYTFGSGRPFREAGPAMLSHAEAAVALAPDSVWAHAALSRALASHWRWAESEREMKRACALDPLRGEHCGSTRAFLCGALGCVQDSIEGARMFVRAMPAEGMSWDTLAGALMNSGQLEEAEAAARRAVELGVPWSNLQDILWRRGKRDEAVENLRRGFAALGSVSAASEIERLRATGPEVAMRWVADQNAHGPLGASWPNINDYLAGLFYAELGDMDAALESIERSVAEHELGMNASAIDPIFDPIRDTPRFRALIEKMGLTAYHAKYLKPRGTGD
jgi:TolB-like protein